MDCRGELRAADEHALRCSQIDTGKVSWGKRVVVRLLRTDSPRATPQQAGCLSDPTREGVQVIELTPSPPEVADLLIEMTRLDWPTTEEDRRCYLGLHDLDTLPPSGSDEPDTMMIRFSTSLPGVDGTCTMFREEFLGLSLFCYNEPLGDGPEARAGYTRLRDHLDRHFGPPIEEWGTPTEPACLWLSGLLSIEMYCFQRLRRGIMVGPSQSERSAANDAAHDARQSDQ